MNLRLRLDSPSKEIAANLCEACHMAPGCTEVQFRTIDRTSWVCQACADIWEALQ